MEVSLPGDCNESLMGPAELLKAAVIIYDIGLQCTPLKQKKGGKNFSALLNVILVYLKTHELSYCKHFDFVLNKYWLLYECNE